MNKSSSPHIIIIGAGLCGLNLAQGLKKAGVSFTVFERDPSSDFRPQGYRIGIDNDGAQALKQNLTPELWDLFERTCAETKMGGVQLNALDGIPVATPIFGKGGSFPAKPTSQTATTDRLGPYTVDRATVREILLLGLEDRVVFGKSFKRYEITPNGVIVHFTDGASEEGTLLVGSDGVRSPVRQQYLPDYCPLDTTGRCIYGKTPFNDEVVEKLNPEAQKGISFIADKRHETPLTLLVFPVRFPKDAAVESNNKLPSIKDYIYWGLVSRPASFNIDDEKFARLSQKDAVQLSLDLTKDWVSNIRLLFELQDETQVATLILSSVGPNIPVWIPSANITLIGDAIHAMAPTGAAGANTALKDSANLCHTIVEEGVSVESIGRFEEQMREYAQKAVEKSFFGAKQLYNQPPFEECKPLNF